MKYARIVLRVLCPFWLVGVMWCCQEVWHECSAADYYTGLSVFLATYVMFAVCGFVGGWTGTKDIAFMYPILAIFVAYLANPVASSLRWGGDVFRFRFYEQFTLPDNLIIGSMVILYLVAMRAAVILLRRQGQEPSKSVSVVSMFIDYHEWTRPRLLRVAYVLWILATVWGSQLLHLETVWLIPAIWTLFVVSLVMWGISGWACSMSRYRDIAFVYPAIIVTVLLVANPISAAIHYAGPSFELPILDTFMRFFTRQFSWPNAIFVAANLLFYGIGFMVGHILLRRAQRTQPSESQVAAKA
jgi:hypothetical protein